MFAGQGNEVGVTEGLGVRSSLGLGVDVQVPFLLVLCRCVLSGNTTAGPGPRACMTGGIVRLAGPREPLMRPTQPSQGSKKWSGSRVI